MKTIIELMREVCHEADFVGCSNFFSDGILDSLSVYKLIGLIEKNYNITLKNEDLTPYNFINMEALKTMLINYGINEEI